MLVFLVLLIDILHCYGFLRSVPSSVYPLPLFRHALAVYETYEGLEGEVTKILANLRHNRVLNWLE